MNITGIIVEYNPFHNGHIYHLNKAKELTNPDLVIAVMSGNYTQRGDLSIIDKFKKTEIALKYGIDLVVEMPYISTVQNGYVFGKKAVEILNKLHVNNLVFGSETNNYEELNKYASLEIDVTRLKELLNDGFSYPKAYGLLSGEMYSNDILAVTYLKALKNTNIKPILIQRTNNYHSLEIKEIASASAIRKSIKNDEDYSLATPIEINEPVFIDDLYRYIRNILLTHKKEDIENIFLVNEGIENLLIKNASLYDNYEDFIRASVSKRYTKSRIQRILCHIACNVKKEDVKELDDNYIRILGFNQRGKEYLNIIKKEENLNLVTQFKNLPQKVKEIEWKTSIIYSSLSNKQNEYLKKELKGPIIHHQETKQP